MEGIIALIRAWAGNIFDSLSDEYIAMHVEEGKFQDQVKMYDAGCRFVDNDKVVITCEEYETLKSYISEEQAIKIFNDMLKEQLFTTRKGVAKEVLTNLSKSFRRVKASQLVIDFIKTFAADVYEADLEDV